MLEADHTEPVDPGLLILLLSLRCHGVDAEVEPVRQRYGSAPIGIAEMLRCAREFGLKARAPKAKWKELARMPMPVIAELRDGTCGRPPRTSSGRSGARGLTMPPGERSEQPGRPRQLRTEHASLLRVVATTGAE